MDQDFFKPKIYSSGIKTPSLEMSVKSNFVYSVSVKSCEAVAEGGLHQSHHLTPTKKRISLPEQSVRRGPSRKQKLRIRTFQ